MRPAKLLDIAHDAGVGVRVEGGRLRLLYPPDADAAVLDQLRTAKAEIVDYLTADWMPAGFGHCPVCQQFRHLKAGPTTTPCDDCTIAADPGEVTLRGEAGL